MSEAVAQKLDEARALIEKGWCRFQFATTAGGNGCMAISADAARFCSLGAIWRVTSYESAPHERILERVVGASLPDWNDAPERTQAEVIEAFKKAAELARGEA